MKVSRTYLHLILIVLFTKCTDPPDKKKAIEISHSVDSTRITYNLPLIPENFILESYGLDFAMWANTKKQFPEYRAKSIFWDSAGVYLERNYFYNSEVERLQIYCVFREQKDIDTFGVCRFYQKNLADTGKFLSKIEADSILKNWGLLQATLQN